MKLIAPESSCFSSMCSRFPGVPYLDSKFQNLGTAICILNQITFKVRWSYAKFRNFSSRNSNTTVWLQKWLSFEAAICTRNSSSFRYCFHSRNIWLQFMELRGNTTSRCRYVGASTYCTLSDFLHFAGRSKNDIHGTQYCSIILNWMKRS